MLHTLTRDQLVLSYALKEGSEMITLSAGIITLFAGIVTLFAGIVTLSAGIITLFAGIVTLFADMELHVLQLWKPLFGDDYSFCGHETTCTT